MVDEVWTVPRLRERGQQASTDPLPPCVVTGLSKIEAEDLLDLLEAAGYELCQLSFVDGEGFSVRPSALQARNVLPPEQA